MKLYGGIDLHSNNSVIALSDEEDRVVFRRREANDLERVLSDFEPYGDGIEGLVVESTYNGYWLVDGLMAAGYRLHLADLALAVNGNLTVMRTLDEVIGALEKRVKARIKLRPEFKLLLTVSGIGQILGLTILLESGEMTRFAKLSRGLRRRSVAHWIPFPSSQLVDYLRPPMTLLLLSKKPFSLAMYLVAALLLVAPPLANAVEVAPRISDREIIASLTELKAGQKALEARMDQRFEAFQQQIDQRFEAVDQQLDKIWALMLVMIAGIFGLIGYIVWDRKTALRPVEQRIMALEAEFHRDLEIQHEDGSRLTRLVKVLREMAKSDEKLADVLRSFSLL